MTECPSEGQQITPFTSSPSPSTACPGATPPSPRPGSHAHRHRSPAPRLPEEVHAGLQGTERLSSFHSRPGHQHRVGPGFHFIYCLKLAPGETGPFPRAEKG